MQLAPITIKGAWATAVQNYDQVLSTEVAKKFLVEGHSQESLYKRSMDAMEARRADAPAFFANGDYDWAFNSESYDFPIEATYQVRCIDAAVGLWKAKIRPLDEARDALGQIVARTTFLLNYRDGLPHMQPYSGINFVICPMAWADFNRWYFSGFAACLGASEIVGGDTAAVWNGLNCDNDMSASNSVRPYWLTLVANIAASFGCIYDIAIPQVINQIVANVPELHEMIPDDTKTGATPLANSLSYLSVEMSLSHEVGHVFSGDQESSADFYGLGAFMSSWGWRAWCLEGAPLSDLGRIVAGALAFSNALQAIVTARSFISDHLDPSSMRSANYRSTAKDAIGRGQQLLKSLDNYLRFLSRSGKWPERASDEPQLAAFAKRLGSYAQDFAQFVKEFHSEPIRAAHRIAELQQLES